MNYFIKLNKENEQVVHNNNTIKLVKHDNKIIISSISSDHTKIEIHKSIEDAVGLSMNRDMKIFEIKVDNTITKNNYLYCDTYDIIREIPYTEIENVLSDPAQSCMWALKINSAKHILEKFKNDYIWNSYYNLNKLAI